MPARHRGGRLAVSGTTRRRIVQAGAEPGADVRSRLGRDLRPGRRPELRRAPPPQPVPPLPDESPQGSGPTRRERARPNDRRSTHARSVGPGRRSLVADGRMGAEALLVGRLAGPRSSRSSISPSDASNPESPSSPSLVGGLAAVVLELSDLDHARTPRSNYARTGRPRLLRCRSRIICRISAGCGCS